MNDFANQRKYINKRGELVVSFFVNPTIGFHTVHSIKGFMKWALVSYNEMDESVKIKFLISEFQGYLYKR